MLLSIKQRHPPAILALADGTVFIGNSIGAASKDVPYTVGEVVFNTSMTGYQEILTDPSYCQQIVTLTYPHIGNYGISEQDVESAKVNAAGLIIRDLPLIASNFRSSMSLTEYLVKEKTIAIANIDTRQLTRHLRTHGAQNGCIFALADGESVTQAIKDKAIALAKSAPNMAGLDLAKVVTTSKPYNWTQTEWQLHNPTLQGKAGYSEQTAADAKFHVVAYDFGVKFNILRMLAERGCRVTVVPAQTSAADVLKLNPNGIFLSNGPGDPEPCDYAITAAKELIETGIPTFGICLGHQIMALASGAKTFKMKFGHHGANHPVKDQSTGKVEIVSMNHGFAIDTSTLPKGVKETHVSLFDGSNCGIELEGKPVFSVQYHPEASPGPHDSRYLFEKFTRLMDAYKAQRKQAG